MYLLMCGISLVECKLMVNWKSKNVIPLSHVTAWVHFERVYLLSQSVILAFRCYTIEQSTLDMMAVAISGFLGEHIFAIFVPMSHHRTTLPS